VEEVKFDGEVVEVWCGSEATSVYDGAVDGSEGARGGGGGEKLQVKLNWALRSQQEAGRNCD